MEKEAYEPVITGLERAPAIIVPLVLEMPEALRKRRPSAGKWSAHEHACHMGLVHPMAFERLRLMLEVEHPTIKPYNPDRKHSPDDPGQGPGGVARRVCARPGGVGCAPARYLGKRLESNGRPSRVRAVPRSSYCSVIWFLHVCCTHIVLKSSF